VAWGIRPFVAFHRELEPTAGEEGGPLSALLGLATKASEAKPAEGTRGRDAPPTAGAEGTGRPPRVRSTWEILYPLSYFRTEADAGRYFFVPLYFRGWRTAANGQRETATAIFPLVMWGRSATGGAWFSIPLLGGVTRGLLGQDSITSVSILYHRLSWTGTVSQRAKAEKAAGKPAPYVQHYILWPLLSIASDGQGHRAFRLWPFYGRTEQKGEWANGYVLWPFYSWGRREAAAGKKAGHYWLFWPIWGESHARDRSSGSIAGFFYNAWNHETGYRAWSYPWPFVTGHRSPTERVDSVWPFYGRRWWPTGTEYCYLGRAVTTSRIRAANTSLDSIKVFPFFAATVTRRKEPAEERVSRFVWPFWRYRRVQKGTEWEADARSLQLAWFADSEGFDRSLGGLLSFYEYEATSAGRRSTRVFLRLVRVERSADSEHVQLGQFASWSRSPGLTKASFLLGLVETGQREGRRGWRVFFVPFGASLSAPPRPSPEGSSGGR
jgi:hypothetical protein